MRNTPNTRTGFAAKRHKALQSNQSQTGIISFSHGWPQGGSRRNHSLLHRMEGRGGGRSVLENDRVFQNSKAGILQARCLSHLSDAPHHEPPGSAGVPPASRAPETGTRRRDAGTPGICAPFSGSKCEKVFGECSPWRLQLEFRSGNGAGWWSRLPACHIWQTMLERISGSFLAATDRQDACPTTAAKCRPRSLGSME